jgi:hypothetical protein
MEEKMATGKSKAEFVADVLNKTISTLITNCTKADGVRNYFDVGVMVTAATVCAKVWVGHCPALSFTYHGPRKVPLARRGSHAVR